MSKHTYEIIGSLGLVILIVIIVIAFTMPIALLYIAGVFAAAVVYLSILKFGEYLGRLAYRKIEKQYD